MMMVRKIESLQEKKILSILCIGAFIARLVTILFFGHDNLILYENGEIAQNLFLGNGYSMAFFPCTPVQETTAMAPFYPYFMAFFYCIFGITTNAFVTIQIIQSIVGSLTIIPLFLLVRNFLSKFGTVICAAFFAIYPDFLITAYYIHPLCFIIFFVVLLTYALVNFGKDPTKPKAAYCGIVFGISLLVEPVIISIFLLGIVWILVGNWFAKIGKRRLNGKKNEILAGGKKEIPQLYFSTVPLKQRLYLILIIVCVTGGILSPWLIRCYQVANHFVFIKNSGHNLWFGNNEYYTNTGIPGNYSSNGSRTLGQDLIDAVGSTKEGDIDKFLGDLAIQYILNNILTTIMNDIVKFFLFWWFPDYLLVQSPLLRQVVWTPMLALALLGIFINRKRIGDFIPILLPIIGFNAIYTITHVLPRFRVPVQPMIFMFSAFAIEWLLLKILEKKSGKTALETNKIPKQST